MPEPVATNSASIAGIVREWGRIGLLGFGGPPVHIAMLRERVVEKLGWVAEDEFEDAIAATGLLPGPASTQLALFCAWRSHGVAGALIGGLAFIVPGLVAIIALSALFLASSPPKLVLAAGAGAGAAVAAVALSAGIGLIGPSWAKAGGHRERWVAYAAAGAAGAAFAGAWVVLVLLVAGFAELLLRRGSGGLGGFALPSLGLLAPAAISSGGTAALAWVAFKVGALSYGGGFVIIPLMQVDAVDTYGWMSDADFLNAVALGQLTPGPVVHTVAAVGYAAAGVGGALLAAAVAFAPSFALILALAPRFETLRRSGSVRAFLDGAGPAAIGAILGVALPLSLALGEAWQFVVLGLAALALFGLGRGVVSTLLGAAALGVGAVALGLPLP